MIAPELQQGTTPLVKKMAGKRTRDFRNYQHPKIVPADYGGVRAVLSSTGNEKLVVRGLGEEQMVELYDLSTDPSERTDLSELRPNVAAELLANLRSWQTSVLSSLSGEGVN